MKNLINLISYHTPLGRHCVLQQLLLIIVTLILIRAKLRVIEFIHLFPMPSHFPIFPMHVACHGRISQVCEQYKKTYLQQKKLQLHVASHACVNIGLILNIPDFIQRYS